MYLIMVLFSFLNFCVFLFSFICGGFFAYINRALQRSPRGRARRAPFLTRRKIHFCGLFTKKFGLSFKGSAASVLTHSQRHLHARPSASQKVCSDNHFLKEMISKEKRKNFKELI